jgi:16S rRNA (guanine966-N2)-methyltransferase
MRITGGRWAGRTLVSPAGRVRPTAEAVREATLAVVHGSLERARVLDLFAGTGAIGLEALSRGAASCDFVENHPSALHALKANITQLRVRERCRIFKRDAIPFVERLAPMSYDIAFADPPYGSRKLDRVVRHWVAAPFSRILVLEHDAAHVLELPGIRHTSRRVDDTVITVLRAPGRTTAPAAHPRRPPDHRGSREV